MAYDVFISHSSRDKPAADALCAALEHARIRCWIAPRDLIPGRPFSGEIIRGIKSCRVMVLVFSSSSNESPDVLREVQLATRHRLHLINFRIEQAPVSEDLDYFLGIPHWLDALTQPMAEHHARLAESIKSLLALDPPPAVPASALSPHGAAPAHVAVEDEERDELLADEARVAAGKVDLGLREKAKVESKAPAPPPRPISAPTTSEPPPRRSRTILVASIAVLIAGTVAATLWWQKRPTDPAPNSAAASQPQPASSSTPTTPATPISAPTPAPAPAVASTPVSSAAPTSPSPAPATPAPPAPPLTRSDLPPELAQAAAAQPWVNSLEMKFVRVPVADGSTAGQPAFFSIYETRVKDFAAYSAANPEADLGWKDATYDGQSQAPEHPVINVSVEESQAFCAWLTKKEHAAKRLPESLCYRLPTDHEWSIAVGLKESPSTLAPTTAPTDKIYPWTAALPPGTPSWPPKGKVGNYGDATAQAKLGVFRLTGGIPGGYDDGFAFTAPVGSYPPTPLGIYDLGGNAWEWCATWADEDHNYRVARGASWMVSGEGDCLSGYRSMGTLTSRNIDRGFRVVVGEPLK